MYVVPRERRSCNDEFGSVLIGLEVRSCLGYLTSQSVGLGIEYQLLLPLGIGEDVGCVGGNE